MLPAIGDLISVCFYDGELKSDPREPSLNLSLAGFERPVTWFSTSGETKRRQIDCKPGFKNVYEADFIRDLLNRINFCVGEATDRVSVAVLTGYVAQRTELERRIDNLHGSMSSLSIECGTVDSFQGRQADVSIFSVTKSNPDGDIGFFKDLRRLNVALSRGKEALAIVGDFSFALSAEPDNPLRKVAQYIQDNPDTCCVKPV